MSAPAARPSPADQRPARRALYRRIRYGAATIVLLVAATASCITASVLAAAHRVRVDVTATRDHTLALRTLRMLERLTEPHEIVVVADAGAVDPRAAARINDVLAEFDHASPFVTSSVINAASPTDRERYAALLDRIASLRTGEVSRRVDAVRAAAASAARIAEQLPSLSDRLLAVAEALPANDPRRRQLTSTAAVARTWVRELAQIAQLVDGALEERLVGSSVPAFDRAEQAVAPPLRRLASELEALREGVDQLARQLAQEQSPALEATGAAAREVVALRDAASAGAERIERLGPSELGAIVRTLGAGPGAVIVSPSGATAVQFSSLFPASEVIDRAGGVQADMRFTGEELLATAIGALSSRDNPVLVFVHANPSRLFDDSGRPASAEVQSLMGRLLDRLRLRGMAITEWAASLDPAPPALGAIDPDARRPVVFITLGFAATTAEGAERLGRMSSAVAGLIDAGAALLVSVEPSTLPAVGEPDPMVAFLEPFGVKVDSGRPLMRRQSTPQGFAVAPGQLIVGQATEHPIGEATGGLSTLLPWPLAITLAPGASAWPLLTVPADANVWGESQWLEFRALSPAQRRMLSNPPSPDERRDSLGGPWIVAVAAERRAGAGPAQRMVVVGANGWFFDEFTQESRVIDGRTVTLYPGNAELLEAAVYWLAGQDELIAPSPRTRDVSRIASLAPEQLTALRWGLIAGLPAATLLVGVALRFLRG